MESIHTLHSHGYHRILSPTPRFSLSSDTIIQRLSIILSSFFIIFLNFDPILTFTNDRDSSRVWYIRGHRLSIHPPLHLLRRRSLSLPEPMATIIRSTMALNEPRRILGKAIPPNIQRIIRPRRFTTIILYSGKYGWRCYWRVFGFWGDA